MNDNDNKRKNSKKAWEETAVSIWQDSARQLSVSLRYLFAALNSLKKASDPRFAFTATDGENIFYNPMKLVMRSRQGIRYINRAYVHMLMHCIFPAVRKASGLKGEERRLWDIASDIHAEYMTDGFQTPALILPESDSKANVYKHLTETCGVLSVENIFSQLHKESFEDVVIWEELFYIDDHSLWEKASDDSKESWQKQSRALTSILPAYGTGKGESRLMKSLKASSRPRMSYREFLKKFMRMRENSQLDPDSFDPGYYNYGLTVYGNMPLIEEPETKEENTVEELIVVIDTSGSCAGETVERFLEETVSLLDDLRGVSGQAVIRLVECDREVLSDTIIPPNVKAADILKDLQIKGFGGTDFRPAFQYVRNLVSDGRRVTGMIYFTDGYGTYPSARPPWKSAFIFDREPDFDDEQRMGAAAMAASVSGGKARLRPPSWALTHVLCE